MKINTALILCAGLGKRLNPLTLATPKPLLELDGITILERCINIIIKLGIKKIFLNTFHLSSQILEFIEIKKFPIDIQIIEDGKEILDTGGGILNMIENSKDNDFIIFNPDTLWHKYYINEINDMKNFYFSKKLNNILFLVNKKLSFDKNLKGDFDLKSNLLKKNVNNDFIYIGCQILNRNLFEKYNVRNFSISEIWNELLKKDKLNGFESSNKFHHLTNLEIFKKLKDF
ncbi:NTP transferase domain-containing protein [Pelagibacterales bacterium SAG-MED39]|nr:NTP transferase domain-containing protein [Pelagibacterales bacterium SAG-MED39]